ncbi:MAG: hypothetical protein ACFFD2_17845 [Promethearchaeota archaeon]
MGKKEIQNKAEELGLTRLPLTVLYSQPKKIFNKDPMSDNFLRFISTQSFSKLIPDTVFNILRHLNENINDPSFIFNSFEGARTKKYFYLAPKSNLYVELICKVSGYIIFRTSNHVVQIKIYSDNEEYKRAIANVVNDAFKNGVLANINWKKIEKKFKVKKEDCIATWKALLEKN